jgi:hypothetical protein
VPKRLFAASGCLAVAIAGGIGVAALGGIGVGIAAVVAPNLLTGVFGKLMGVETIQSRPVAGDPAHYDPIAGLPAMRAFAGEGAQLTQFEASFVRSDGTLDLTASYTPSPRVTTQWLVKVPPPSDAPPVGAGGLGTWYRRVTIDAYRPGQGGRVTTRGPGGSFSYQYENEGMTRRSDAPAALREVTVLEPPRCALSKLWQVARERGAPDEAVAVIEYTRDGYDFTIRDVRFSLAFDHGCQPRSLR